MRARIRTWITWATVLFLLHLAPTAQACATCFGKSDSKLAEGVNWGIFTLLLVIMSVLGAISAFFIFIARRAASLSTNDR